MEYPEIGDGDIISKLPEHILHRILYFLPKRDAAKTCLLSKSWRQIWSTRPKLAFRQTSRDRATDKAKHVFLTRVDNALQAHLDHNLHLEKLRLVITLLDSNSISLLEKWIPLLDAIGVRGELYLSIHSERKKVRYVRLPPVVLTHVGSLKLLSLHKCKLSDQECLSNIPLINYTSLEVIRLNGVSVQKEIFDRIILSCPKIRTIWLKDCKGLKKIKLVKEDHKYLEHFTFTSNVLYALEQFTIEIDDLENLETISVLARMTRFRSNKYDNLKSLSLKFVSILFDNPSLKFPSLESLSLKNCYGFARIHLEIDAPKIRFFYYRGDFIPSISFTESYGDWKSKIYIVGGFDDAMWLFKLSQLLEAISRSEICLDIFPNPRNIINFQENFTVQESKRVGVTLLQLNDRLSAFPSLLNSLFGICCPRDIAMEWHTTGNIELEREQKEFTEFLLKILMRRGSSGNQEINQNLADVISIGSFDTSRSEWQSIKVPNLLECSLPDDKFHHRVCFRYIPPPPPPLKNGLLKD